MVASSSGFEPLGVPPPAALADARVELHWAVQIFHVGDSGGSPPVRAQMVRNFLAVASRASAALLGA